MMKRISLVLIFFLFSVCVLSAQNNHRIVQPFEGEVGLGMIINAERGHSPAPGFSFFVEGRYNFRRSGFDLGVQLFAGRWTQEWRRSVPIRVERIKPLILTIYSDYNFRRGKNVSIFVGAGPALTYNIDASFHSNHYLTLSTRAGVELFHPSASRATTG